MLHNLCILLKRSSEKWFIFIRSKCVSCSCRFKMFFSLISLSLMMNLTLYPFFVFVECALAPFVSGSSAERIPFVFLPLRGQIIHPSKEINFQGKSHLSDEHFIPDYSTANELNEKRSECNAIYKCLSTLLIKCVSLVRMCTTCLVHLAAHIQRCNIVNLLSHSSHHRHRRNYCARS